MEHPPKLAKAIEFAKQLLRLTCTTPFQRKEHKQVTGLNILVSSVCDLPENEPCAKDRVMNALKRGIFRRRKDGSVERADRPTNSPAIAGIVVE